MYGVKDIVNIRI